MELKQRAQRDLNNLAGFVRREGLTGWVKDRNASMQYERAFESVVAYEDEVGVEAAARLGDRLFDLRVEAMDRHLLSPMDVCDAEARALARLDRKVSA